MTVDLTEFLRARLDEDEAAARAACEYASASWRLADDGETILWWPPKPSAADAERRIGLQVTSDRWHGQTIDADGPHIAPHIARWGPARVLADVAAKRRIVEGLPVYESRSLDVDGHPVGIIRTLTGWAYHQAMLALAQPYAEHPDFDPAWRIE